jgi:hypothetical protein
MTKRHAAEIAEIVSNALADVRADTDQLCIGLAIVMMQITQEGLRNRNMRRLNADELREALHVPIDSVVDAGIATGAIKQEGGQ